MNKKLIILPIILILLIGVAQANLLTDTITSIYSILPLMLAVDYYEQSHGYSCSEYTSYESGGSMACTEKKSQYSEAICGSVPDGYAVCYDPDSKIPTSERSATCSSLGYDYEDIYLNSDSKCRANGGYWMYGKDSGCCRNNEPEPIPEPETTTCDPYRDLNCNIYENNIEITNLYSSICQTDAECNTGYTCELGVCQQFYTNDEGDTVNQDLSNVDEVTDESSVTIIKQFITQNFNEPDYTAIEQQEKIDNFEGYKCTYTGEQGHEQFFYTSNYFTCILYRFNQDKTECKLKVDDDTNKAYDIVMADGWFACKKLQLSNFFNNFSINYMWVIILIAWIFALRMRNPILIILLLIITALYLNYWLINSYIINPITSVGDNIINKLVFWK